jgi:hypothetical protein
MQNEQIILDAIKTRSKSNPIQNKSLRYHIQKETGAVISERKLKEIVETLRKQGEPVLASREKPFGYFYASSIEEIKDFERTFLSQAKTTFRTFRAMRKNYQKLSGQQELI